MHPVRSLQLTPVKSFGHVTTQRTSSLIASCTLTYHVTKTFYWNELETSDRVRWIPKDKNSQSSSSFGFQNRREGRYSVKSVKNQKMSRDFLPTSGQFWNFKLCIDILLSEINQFRCQKLGFRQFYKGVVSSFKLLVLCNELSVAQ